MPTDERVTDKDLKERIENRPQYFHGYNCTKDCSGHEAGYNWAMKNNIMWKSECPNTSKSFNEGCKAWVEN
ncbi:hypothetical protein KC845_01435 [Candidatus Kaiserbacteria bacterium]|nr:hypothetical protein [Candidatus Kaiserbacteria bacterium]